MVLVAGVTDWLLMMLTGQPGGVLLAARASSCPAMGLCVRVLCVAGVVVEDDPLAGPRR